MKNVIHPIKALCTIRHALCRQLKYFSLTVFLCFAALFSQQSSKPTPPKAWIGIAFLDVPTSAIPSVYSHKTVNGAVQIQKVIPGASGEQAGLKSEDYVLAINGVPLNGRTTLLKTVNSKSIGDVIELKIGRNGKSFLQKMALSPRPADMRAIAKTLIGSQAPELDGTFYANDCGLLKENRDKVIILDFWATWCNPCRITLPSLEALYKKYRSKGLLIIGVSSESRSTLKPFQNPPKA